MKETYQGCLSRSISKFLKHFVFQKLVAACRQMLCRQADYIAVNLRNPIAAENFVDCVESAIIKRLETPEAFEPYHSVKKRNNVYYAIPVKNYLVFYVVIDNVMEVRTLVYAKRDITKII